MKRRTAICIVVDGLRASALGAYGNTTHPTSHLDRLASRSLVAEWLLADSLVPELFYRSLWQGRHALRPEAAQTSAVEILNQQGIEQVLLTDEPWLAQHAGESSIDEIQQVESSREKSAESIGETALGGLFAAVVSQLADWNAHAPDADRMLWVHARGLLGPWDAPLSMREALLDPEDPPPADYLWPPEKLADAGDPDELLLHRSAYTAQIAVLDSCIGAILAQLEESSEAQPTLVMLIGMRGFGLGEHGELGIGHGHPYSEQIHVPWLLHRSEVKHSSGRLGGLWQPADVGATLLDWFGASRTAMEPDGRSVISLHGEEKKLAFSLGKQNQQMVRTPAWALYMPPVDMQGDSTDSADAQLFVKPDDRWEVNDVAIRCPQEVQEMQSLLSKCFLAEK